MFYSALDEQRYSQSKGALNCSVFLKNSETQIINTWGSLEQGHILGLIL